MGLEILFQDDDLIAINKPHGLLVHRTKIANDATEFALQMVRDLIGQRVFPVHRLDRKTSGILLFAKSNKTLKTISKLFAERQVNKSYLAIIRGFAEAKGMVDYPLTEGNTTQEAITAYKVLKQFELDLPYGKFDTTRYSLVEIKPETGRFHQIRKHFAHLRHPIIGDRPHGCNKQNKLWKDKFNMTTMLLHASSLEFNYPDNTPVQIEAEISSEFERVLEILKFTDY